MKSLYLLSSIGIATLLSTTPVKAEGVIPHGAPGLPTTYAEAMENPRAGAAWQQLAEALKICQDEHSEDNLGWKECIDTAQGEYEKATNPAVAEGVEPFQGEILPVGTKEADSDYKNKGPDHKGFMNAQE